MKYNKKRLCLYVFIGYFFFFMTLRVSAIEKQELIQQVGFIYTIHHPENQQDNGVALNLKMQVGQKQQVPVTIENLGEKDLTLDISLNGARTNSLGTIEYGPSSFEKDKSMQYDLPDLVKVPKEITIPAKSSKDIVLDITMPEQLYDGIVTGGVQIQEKDQTKEKHKSTGIVNKIAYLFGVTLQMTDRKIIPNMDVVKVYPKQNNYRNAIFVDLANVQAMKLENVDLEIKIKEKNKNKVLYETKKSTISMAPNTVMNYPVSLNGEKMIPGEYTAYIVTKANGKTWKWTKDFQITKETANTFNKEDVSLIQDRAPNWKYIVISIFVGLVMVTIFIIIYKQRKK